MTEHRLYDEPIYGAGAAVYAVPDLPSESYEAWSLVCRNSAGRRVWSEGIARDRSAMYDDVRECVDAFLASPAAHTARNETDKL